MFLLAFFQFDSSSGKENACQEIFGVIGTICDIGLFINQLKRFAVTVPMKSKHTEDAYAGFQPTPEEACVARRLQGNIPVVERPFRKIGEEIGLPEREVLAIVERMKARGYIRKFGAIIRHQLAGYTNNAMVVWAVAPAQCEAAGKKLASFPEITHCYERSPAFEGRYTIFTMIHFRQDTEKQLLHAIAAATGVDDFKVLRSLEEFKKNSMEYF
jgi:siroheme decarboxylase